MTTAIATNTKDKTGVQEGVIFYLNQGSPEAAYDVIKGSDLESEEKIDLYEFFTNWLAIEELSGRLYQNVYDRYESLAKWLVYNESLNAIIYKNIFTHLSKDFIKKELMDTLYNIIIDDKQYGAYDTLLVGFTNTERLKFLEGFWTKLIALKFTLQKRHIKELFIPKIEQELSPKGIVKPSTGLTKLVEWHDLFFWCGNIKNRKRRKLYTKNILQAAWLSQDAEAIKYLLDEEHENEGKYRKDIDDFFNQFISFFKNKFSLKMFMDSLREPFHTAFLNFQRRKEREN